MSIQRKLHKPEFKAKVAIAALRGDKTTSQLSSKFGVHSTMISGWKRTLVEGAASLFETHQKRQVVNESQNLSLPPRCQVLLLQSLVFVPSPEREANRLGSERLRW
ncbi:MAG: hypothetical protein HW380_1339 [Magnetococcales bacterium]|nr:hypothetical protein [Magnetococcales bacterium]